MSAPDTEELLADLFEANAPIVDEEALRRRVTAGLHARARSRRRTRGVRRVAVACAALVVVAAAGYGVYAAFSHSRPRTVIVLTESTSQAAGAVGSSTSAPASSSTSTTDVMQNPAVQADAQLMTSAPVVLSAGGEDFTLTAGEIAAALEPAPYSETTPPRLHLRADRLAAFFARVEPSVEVAPVDATFDSDGEKVWVVPGKDGTAIDAEKTAAALTVAASGDVSRTAEVVLKAKEPDITTAEAQAMGIGDRLAAYTTRYEGPVSRTVNVKVATQYAGGVLLAPGEEYDLDESIGPRTRERGFSAPPAIIAPGQLVDILSGALGQVATTVYNAAFEAGLKIDERHNSGIYISHYPKGRDAALVDGGKNVRFTNDTDHYIWIAGTSDGTTTNFAIWGTDDGRRVETSVGEFYDLQPITKTTVTDPHLKTGRTVVEQPGQDGRSLKVTRLVTRNGVVIHNDVFTSVWPMLPREIAIGTGK